MSHKPNRTIYLCRNKREYLGILNAYHKKGYQWRNTTPLNIIEPMDSYEARNRDALLVRHREEHICWGNMRRFIADDLGLYADVPVVEASAFLMKERSQKTTPYPLMPQI